MERNKSNNCVRSHKKVAGPVGNEFFPLGAKSTREDPKHKVPTSKTSNIADRKREASSSISNVNKKPRLSRSSGEACGNIVQELWEQMAIDCEVVELLDGIYSILDEFEDENVLRLICGSIKHFIEPYSRMKFDTVLYLAILFIAKLRPAILRTEVISSALVYVLRRDSNLKLRQSSYSHVLASNLLTKGYNERQNWPELFLRLYIDDAINERVWADNELCMPFINNICSAFRTTAPLNTTLQQENVSFGGVSSGPHRDVPLGIEDDSGDSSIQGIDPNVIMHIFDVESDTSTFIRNRFIDNEHIVKKYVVDAIKDQLNKRQQPDCYTRNILKFLCSTAGLDEVRCISVTRLELWIHNGKLVKLAQQLLSYICVNIRANNCKDHEILSLLVKIRLKSKPFINFYMICIKEMIMQQPDILCIMLKLVVQNELSNTRNPNNMGMIATMFQTSPDQSSSHLAEIYKEFLLQREDCLRTLRVFLRELIRILRFDMNIKQFCKVFLNDRLDLMEQIERSDYRDRIFHSMVDLVCLCMLLSVSPQIREACILLRSTRDIKSNPMLIQFYSQISTIQLDAISWMYEIVPKLFKLQNAEYNQALHKLLLLDNPEQYSRCDQWPSEPERGTLLRIISETPVREETLLRIILIGITKENPFTIPDTIDIIMMVIKRASTMRITNCPAVQTNKYDIIDFLFSMVEYHYPENIKLPVDYNPPKFAIITLYWKAWLIMLMISAHNPSTFGAFCWEHYPTMKHLIEMCITNQFQEQMTVKDELQAIVNSIHTLDNLSRKELLFLEIECQFLTNSKNLTNSQYGEYIYEFEKFIGMNFIRPEGNVAYMNANIAQQKFMIISMERDRILQFETYLAAQTSQTIITEENAILISQLILMDPLGPARRIPTAVLDQIKNLNKTLKLGNLLCRCRKPDLLLDIIQRQGTTKSMPWLSDLVQNCDGDFSHLPVQCLCEFLLFNAHAINEENSRESDLISYIRNLIMENNSNNKIVCEVLDYIFRRLSSTVNFSRNAALRGLKIIFKCSPKEENDWLLRSIPQVPSFREICSFVIPQLRSACQVENSPKLVMLYIEFVAAHTIHNSAIEMLDHVIDMAQLIVERSTMFQHIIPSSVEILFTESVQDNLYENRFQTLKCLFVMFNNYVIKLREHQEPFDWTEYPDLIMVQFDDGIQLPLHLNIIHAFIILLTYSSNRMPESIPILDYWFPPGRTAPTAFLPNLPQETVQLLPDWLKLKMIRSSVDRLVEAALYDLTPDQIVLFVQNFGTPVNSMSKLLALLDHAVNEQFDAVRDAILNKAYLAQLIEIQQVRGAKNGHFTVKVLGLHSHSQTVPDLPKLNNEVLKSFSFSNNGSTMTSSMVVCKSIKDVEDIICAIFKCRHLNPINSMRFRKVIHQLLQRGQNANNVFNKKKFSHGLVRIIERFKTLVLFQNKSQLNHVCTLIRALLRYGAMLFDGGHPILQIIKDFEPLLTKKISFSENQISYYHLSLFLILQKPNNSLPEVWIQPNSSINKKYKWISDVIENSSEVFHTCDICHDGLLVDHLCEINPELRNFNREKQFINLLLNKYKDFRFYLLSLICHQTNWETVIYILQYFILHSHTTVDCSIVLNFIEALINNPKLWQGRQDKIMSKANLSEKLFSFNKDELNAFTEYILKEGEVEIETLEKYDFKLCSRINLVLRVISRNKNDLLTFIKNVFRNCCPELLKLKVIYQIYLLYPSIVYFANNTKDHIIKLQTLKGCKADKVSNYLITCLGNLLLKKDFEALSSDTEILIRKFAASHPALFLRQLGVLSSLVEGRAQLNSRVLRDEYHFHRFVQILRTMQVLEPMIFDDTYKTDFQALLGCYFMFLKHHSYVKETYHILIKFVELLQAYININPASALLYIEHYVGILMELSAKFNSILQLQQLVQGIALLQQKNLSENQLSEGELKQDFDFEEQNDIKTTTNVSIVSEAEIAEAGAIHQLETNKKGTVSFALSSTLHKCSTLSNHYMDLIKIIKLSNSEDSILNPLQEIESFTSKRFSLLSEIFDRLLELIFSTRAQIRSNAFILLIRHLKHNPGHSDTSRCALNAYIQCLRDDNSSVATTAVDNLVEITLLLQEHAVEILSVAFSLGVKSRINTSIQIKRVLQTLMLQHGY